MITEKPLSLRAVKYVDYLLLDPEMNQERAACNAGFAPRRAGVTACLMMKDPRVQALIAERSKARIARVELTQDDVLLDLYNVATADPRALTEWHVGCCRYCHGVDFQYQCTPQEWRDNLAVYLKVNKELDPAGIAFPVRGGVGYDARKPPREDCPECFGVGVGREVIKDTRTLSKAAATLFAGVKKSKHGVEIAMRSKDKAIELAARHTGIIKSSVEVTGKDGKPIQHILAAAVLAIDDPVEASRAYQTLMGGGD
jgi:phage terminase small subunit